MLFASLPIVQRVLRRFLPLLVGSLSLTACISGPDNRLILMEAPAPSAEASIFVVSTRARSDEEGVVYSGARSPTTEFSIFDIAAPPGHETGRLELPLDGSRLNPERHFIATNIEQVRDEQEIRAQVWLDTQATRGRVLIFVHGYNVTFDAAVFGLAQMKIDSGMDQAPILFAWPSSGRLNGYLYDRESANYSRDDLESLITLAAQHPDVEDITIFAHSMGSWLTMEALRQYAIRNGSIPAKITNVVLASPDLDVDVFWRQIETLGPSRPPFTIMITRDDRALWFSRLAAGASRLGGTDPTRPEVMERLSQIQGMTVLDLTGLSGGDYFRHSSFLTVPEIVGHLGTAILNENSLTHNYGMASGLVLDVGRVLTTPMRGEVAPLVFVPAEPVSTPEADGEADPAGSEGRQTGYAIDGDRIIEFEVPDPVQDKPQPKS